METSKKLFWAGWVLTVLPALMLLFSAWMKLSQSAQAVDGFKAMGFPEGSLMAIGIVELLCTVLYVIPKTSVVGAILLVGYLGGAVCVHVMQGQSVVIPVALGVVVWGGLFLRDARVRALIPIVR